MSGFFIPAQAGIQGIISTKKVILVWIPASLGNGILICDSYRRIEKKTEDLKRLRIAIAPGNFAGSEIF